MDKMEEAVKSYAFLNGGEESLWYTHSTQSAGEKPFWNL